LYSRTRIGPLCHRGGDKSACAIVVSIKRASIIEPLLGADGVSGARGGSTAKARGTTAQPNLIVGTRQRGRPQSVSKPVFAVDLFGVDSVPDGYFG
jgi:hypothetical protein